MPLSIDDWFNEIIWPYEMNITGDDVYVGAKAAICEMIGNGVTAFADHYLYADRIYEAVEELGMKADIAITVFGMAEDYKDQLNNAVKLIKENNGKNEIQNGATRTIYLSRRLPERNNR